MTLVSQRNAGVLRPGLIIVAGVVAIALILITVLLLPPPNIRGAAERLIPAGATILSELKQGDLIGMSASTDAALVDLAAFYRKRLRLGSGTIVGGGISSWMKSKLFGGVSSGVTMPYAKEGFVIIVVDKNEFLAVIASRATNESATCIEIFCKRKQGPRVLQTRANTLSPVDGVTGSSATIFLGEGAMFTSGAKFENIVADYFTKVLKTQPPAPTNHGITTAGSGIISIPKRASANSATFLASPHEHETVLIHCFRSPDSIQTHVLVGCVAK